MSSDVAAWLMTKEGLAWSYTQFDRDATVYHGIIELIDDITPGQLRSHRWRANSKVFARVRQDSVWSDLEWNPDRSP